MRSILTLVALASIPAFCQDTGQKLTNIAPPALRMSVGSPTPQVCSIPLLNVIPPGKPVPMPTLKPRSKPAIPSSPNHMNIAVPAPACSAPAPPAKP